MADGASGMSSSLEEILERSAARRRAIIAMQDQPTSTRRGAKRRLAAPVSNPILRRALTPLEPKRTTPAIVDFVFENPLDGRFKSHPAIEMLLACYRGRVVARPTSYCHFGVDYRKRTIFVTSLLAFRPPSACPAHPCSHVRAGSPHPTQLIDQCDAVRNSIPAPLVDALLGAWMATHKDWAREFLLIDLFTGWGSVAKRAAERWPAVKVYTNDIADRPGVDATLDLSTDTHVRVVWLMRLAVLRFWPDAPNDQGVMDFFASRRVAVLFHASTPCNTYSTEAIGVHRMPDGAPRTHAAARDDEMNTNLVRFFEEFALARAHV